MVANVALTPIVSYSYIPHVQSLENGMFTMVRMA